MCRLSEALEALNQHFDPMVFQRRMNFTNVPPTRRITGRQRTTVQPPFDRPGAPYDLFLTMSHVIATGAERSIPRDKVNRVANVISDLFFLVEYTLEDHVEDLLSDSVITLHEFFILYGIHPEIIELSDDDTEFSPRHVADFPLEMPLADDDTTISSDDEEFLTQETYITRN